MKKVSLVILHFLDKKLTEQCLESVKKLSIPTKSGILDQRTGPNRLLARQDSYQPSTIVINNNPRESLESLKRKFKKFNFMETKENLGFTGGNNLGIKKALKDDADFVFLVNNDTILDKNLIVQLIKVSDSNSEIGILGPKIYFAPGYEYHQERFRPTDQGKVIWYAGGLIDWQNVLASHRGVDEVDKGQYDEQMETDFVSGCAMFVRREVFEKIGLLDERYFLYLEDNDFCQRAKKAGFRAVYAPKAKVWHANAGSSAVGGPLHDYYLTRNRMLFGMKYAPWRTKLALARESFKLSATGRQWQKIGIRDFYWGRFGKGSYSAG